MADNPSSITCEETMALVRTLESHVPRYRFSRSAECEGRQHSDIQTLQL
jgi:hypothetical protein